MEMEKVRGEKTFVCLTVIYEKAENLMRAHKRSISKSGPSADIPACLGRHGDS